MKCRRWGQRAPSFHSTSSPQHDGGSMDRAAVYRERTCVAILIVAIFMAATWAQFQALRRQHQWPIRERLMTMHDQRAMHAFSTMHDARTVQRSNRASGMLESTIRVRCVCLCCSTACRTGERTILRTVLDVPWSMTVSSLSPWHTFLSLDSTGQNRIFSSRAMPSPTGHTSASHGAAAAGHGIEDGGQFMNGQASSLHHRTIAS